MSKFKRTINMLEGRGYCRWKKFKESLQHVCDGFIHMLYSFGVILFYLSIIVLFAFLIYSVVTGRVLAVVAFSLSLFFIIHGNGGYSE